MGLGCSPKGLVSVTDNDNIELSNLNRQFLFRNKHIGQSKTIVACAEAAKINPKLNTKHYESLVSPDTEDIFNEKFWDSQNYIVNAVDNNKARLYVDSKSVLHNIALFDSGTLGTKANTQLVIPNLTECYGDHQDPEEDSIPMCTLRNFPNQIEHCIEWARARFSDLFAEKPTNLRSYLTDREAYVDKLKKEGNEASALKEMKLIKQLLSLEDFEDCVGFAKQRFYEDHELQIQTLINLFPEDHKDSEGNPFWTGPKRFPTPVEFDAEYELHMDYIVACANLIAASLDIDQNDDRDEIERLVEQAEVDEDVAADDIDLEGDEEAKAALKDKKSLKEKEAEAKEALEELVEEMEELEKDEDNINPAEFEKDDDTNYHIDFIHAAANLRARNYNLEECDKFRSKMIAGKIIPAIATTTATIVGAICIEIVKYIQGFKKLSDYRNSYFNLAISRFVQNEPGEPKKNFDVEMDPVMLVPVKAIPPGWTVWDSIEIKGSKTVKEFIAEMSKKHKVNVNMIVSGDIPIYNEYIKKDSMKDRLDQKIESIYDEITKKKTSGYLVLGVGASTKNGDEASMPKIKYFFSK